MSVDQAKIEARLDQITNMLTELIRIVGNTNAAVEELRSNMNELRNDVDELKSDMKEVKQTLKEHSKKLDYVMYKLTVHDAEIFDLKGVIPK